MQIRRNTKSFKTILEVVSTCQSRPDRQDLIRLYITKAGKSIQERISVESIQGDVEFFYDLNYQAVLNNLKSSTHQLYQSDDIPGIYFFHSTISKDWDETPFEFDPKVVKEFASLPELPAVREKGSTAKFDIAAAATTTATPRAKKEKEKEKPVAPMPTMVVHRREQPDYKLKHDFEFTDLSKVFFRQAKLNKKDVLDHYNKIADYLLPYLKDRPMQVRVQSDSGPNAPRMNFEELPKKLLQEKPSWVQRFSNGDESMFLCNDKEHLMLYVENECIEFDACVSRKNNSGAPDFIVIGVESGSEFSKAIDVASVMREIFDGLHLTSHLKTDGVSGLHVYIATESKSTFETSRNVAEMICKLVRLKIPGLVSLAGFEENSYGKVTLDYSLNEEGKGIVAPYSFVAGGFATIATPILWSEVNEGLKPEKFTHENIFDRLKRVGDPFENLSKKKVNADELLERLIENYSFLL
jgi:bifunctional non-homologous end joining protein LigD